MFEAPFLVIRVVKKGGGGWRQANGNRLQPGFRKSAHNVLNSHSQSLKSHPGKPTIPYTSTEWWFQASKRSCSRQLLPQTTPTHRPNSTVDCPPFPKLGHHSVDFGTFNSRPQNEHDKSTSYESVKCRKITQLRISPEGDHDRATSILQMEDFDGPSVRPRSRSWSVRRSSRSPLACC